MEDGGDRDEIQMKIHYYERFYRKNYGILRKKVSQACACLKKREKYLKKKKNWKKKKNLKIRIKTKLGKKN